MAHSIPYGEPETLRVGDTWTWKLSLGDYPPDVWTLSYILVNSSSKVTISASADGSDHLVAVAATTTAGYTAGSYSWTRLITDGTQRFSIGYGTVDVLTNIASTSLSSHDGRSHVKTMLDAIEAALESRASADQLDLLSTAFGTHAITRDREGLLRWRAKYYAYWQDELATERLAQGTESRYMRTRFR